MSQPLFKLNNPPQHGSCAGSISAIPSGSIAVGGWQSSSVIPSGSIAVGGLQSISVCPVLPGGFGRVGGQTSTSGGGAHAYHFDGAHAYHFGGAHAPLSGGGGHLVPRLPPISEIHLSQVRKVSDGVYEPFERLGLGEFLHLCRHCDRCRGAYTGRDGRTKASTFYHLIDGPQGWFLVVCYKWFEHMQARRAYSHGLMHGAGQAHGFATMVRQMMPLPATSLKSIGLSDASSPSGGSASAATSPSEAPSTSHVGGAATALPSSTSGGGASATASPSEAHSTSNVGGGATVSSSEAPSTPIRAPSVMAFRHELHAPLKGAAAAAASERETFPAQDLSKLLEEAALPPTPASVKASALTPPPPSASASPATSPKILSTRKIGDKGVQKLDARFWKSFLLPISNEEVRVAFSNPKKYPEGVLVACDGKSCRGHECTDIHVVPDGDGWIFVSACLYIHCTFKGREGHAVVHGPQNKEAYRAGLQKFTAFLAREELERDLPREFVEEASGASASARVPPPLMLASSSSASASASGGGASSSTSSSNASASASEVVIRGGPVSASTSSSNASASASEVVRRGGAGSAPPSSSNASASASEVVRRGGAGAPSSALSSNSSSNASASASGGAGGSRALRSSQVDDWREAWIRLLGSEPLSAAPTLSAE